MDLFITSFFLTGWRSSSLIGVWIYPPAPVNAHRQTLLPVIPGPCYHELYRYHDQCSHLFTFGPVQSLPSNLAPEATKDFCDISGPLIH